MDGATGNKKVLCPLSLSLPRLLMSLFAHRFATRAAPARQRAKKLHFPKWTGKERRLRGSGKSLFLFLFLKKETKYPLAGYMGKIICQLLGNICSCSSLAYLGSLSANGLFLRSPLVRTRVFARNDNWPLSEPRRHLFFGSPQSRLQGDPPSRKMSYLHPTE